MSWLAIEKQLSEIDPKYSTYIDRYMKEVPIEVQKQHNYFYPEYLIYPRIYVYINKSRSDEAMLFFYDHIANPGEDAPGAVALFFEDQIIPIHYTTKGLFWNRETKESGILFQIMPFTLPAILKNKENQVKVALDESLKCMQVSRFTNQFRTYDIIQFSYDQPFIPVGNPR